MPKLTIDFSDSAIDFQKVRDASIPYLLAMCHRVLPDGEQEGGEYVALNPLRNDRNLGSFRINLATGRWADFAVPNCAGGDVISLVAYLYEISQREAALVVAQMMGMQS